MRRTAIALRPRSVAALATVSVIGLVMFAWPLLVAPGAGIGQDSTAPLVFAAILPLLLGVVLSEVSEGGLDVKAVAVLGVLSAVGAALRPLGAGTAGIETVFFLLVLGGRVFGPAFGFVLGSTTLATSALLTGGVGPWLPFQMLAASWVGLGAGLLPRTAIRPRRRGVELVLLVAYSAVAAFGFGFLMNLSFWPFALGPQTGVSFVPGAPASENLHRFVLFGLATSMGWDLGRAVTTGLLVWWTGPAVLAALRRTNRRAAFGAAVEFREPSSAAAPAFVPTSSPPAADHSSATPPNPVAE